MQLGLYLQGVEALSRVQSLRGHDAQRQRTSLLIVRTRRIVTANCGE